MTMVGVHRLRQQRQLIQRVQHLPGDFVECGGWRGGASIAAREALDVFGHATPRRVWMFDSFAGLPLPRTSVSEDTAFWHEQRIFEVCAIGVLVVC